MPMVQNPSEQKEDKMKVSRYSSGKYKKVIDQYHILLYATKYKFKVTLTKAKYSKPLYVAHFIASDDRVRGG